MSNKDVLLKTILEKIQNIPKNPEPRTGLPTKWEDWFHDIILWKDELERLVKQYRSAECFRQKQLFSKEITYVKS